MPLLRRALPLTLAAAVTVSASLSAQSNTIGRTVLQRMHDAYAGKWYKSLTFVQRTTTFDSARTPKYETWYETVPITTAAWCCASIGASPSKGNGVLYTADSLWSLRGGKLAAARPTGNPFLPLIQGVYVQPVDKTIRELKQTGVDLSKGYKTQYEGANVTVIGATSAADSTSPQIWIDDARNVLAAHDALLRSQPPADRRPPRRLRARRPRLAGDEGQHVRERCSEPDRGILELEDRSAVVRTVVRRGDVDDGATLGKALG